MFRYYTLFYLYLKKRHLNAHVYKKIHKMCIHCKNVHLDFSVCVMCISLCTFSILLCTFRVSYFTHFAWTFMYVFINVYLFYFGNLNVTFRSQSDQKGGSDSDWKSKCNVKGFRSFIQLFQTKLCLRSLYHTKS